VGPTAVERQHPLGRGQDFSTVFSAGATACRPLPRPRLPDEEPIPAGHGHRGTDDARRARGGVEGAGCGLTVLRRGTRTGGMRRTHHRAQ
jgi:hypothetical protein